MSHQQSTVTQKYKRACVIKVLKVLSHSAIKFSHFKQTVKFAVKFIVLVLNVFLAMRNNNRY